MAYARYDVTEVDGAQQPIQFDNIFGIQLKFMRLTNHIGSTYKSSFECVVVFLLAELVLFSCRSIVVAVTTLSLSR